MSLPNLRQFLQQTPHRYAEQLKQKQVRTGPFMKEML